MGGGRSVVGWALGGGGRGGGGGEGRVGVGGVVEVEYQKDGGGFVGGGADRPEEAGGFWAAGVVGSFNRFGFGFDEGGIFVFMPLWLDAQKLVGLIRIGW